MLYLNIPYGVLINNFIALFLFQSSIVFDKKEISFTTQDLIDNKNINVVCQGTKGAYQHTVSKILFPNSNIDFCDNYKDVFDSINNKTADFAVVPLENSTAGSVTDVYDLLSQYNLYINKTAYPILF